MGWEVRGKFKRQGTYVYLWLTHVDIWQKPTQYYKAIILQLKINLKNSLSLSIYIMLNVFRAEVRKNSKKRGLLSFTDHKIGYILVHGRIWENLLMTISEYCWGYHCSIAQSCPTLCDPMDCSTPGFLVLHYLPEFAQIHVHWVGEAIQPFHPLSSASPPALNFSQHHRLFQWVDSLHYLAKVLELQLQSFQWIFRVDFLSDWLVWSPCCPRDSQSSPAPCLKIIQEKYSLVSPSDDERIEKLDRRKKVLGSFSLDRKLWSCCVFQSVNNYYVKCGLPPFLSSTLCVSVVP